jgi:mono/diheme cytochrome c family protein
MMKPSIAPVLAVVLIAAAGLALTGAAPAGKALRITLPDDPIVTLPSGPGAELAQGTCSACHSLDYIQMQPRGKGPQFWHDEVAKMGKAYGARIAPKDAEEIAAYLGRTYGN